jgi:hypothetical protein
MKIKALVTALVLGSSTLAVAAPSYGPSIRDHRAPAAAPAPAPAPMRAPGYFGFQAPKRPVLSWVTLANDKQLTGRTVIKVAPTARKFTKLELRADQGRAAIDKVTIVFANGRAQTVNLDARLMKKNQSVSIDLAGNSRSIDRIILVGRTMGRGAAVDVLAL